MNEFQMFTDVEAVNDKYVIVLTKLNSSHIQSTNKKNFVKSGLLLLLPSLGPIRAPALCPDIVMVEGSNTRQSSILDFL